jgi:hypothetical protein
MAFERRQFLRQSMAAGVLPWAASACGGESSPGPPAAERWVSAQGDEEATYGLVVGDADGFVTGVRSGFRGHDVAVHPADANKVVMFARRPGREAVVLDIERGRIQHRFQVAPGRRFQGHGFYSNDGAQLYTSEAEVATGAGKIGVRETGDYRQVAELDSFGIGPHEIAPMPDGETMVVANGGVLTRPETGRQKLNLDTMDPSLAYVNRRTGQLLGQYRLPESKAGIRHLDVASDGTVAIGLQVERQVLDSQRWVALGAVHRPKGELEWLPDPDGVFDLMYDYVGSVAISSLHRVVGFSSPRGDVVGFWDLDSGALVGVHGLADVCGLTASGDGSSFIVSSSLGEVRRLDVGNPSATAARWRDRRVRWDNHLIALPIEEETT